VCGASLWHDRKWLFIKEVTDFGLWLVKLTLLDCDFQSYETDIVTWLHRQ
jgi:hypothetical protein